ncbi:DUF1475 family protein [Nevskia sp.]|uniref:DUF1475 family protein n=1 Tax=Nevskia sp. TaxID=1929292 RepID=UPI0025F87D56|nr:DUF1475 family protein [Nevskia sp.]
MKLRIGLFAALAFAALIGASIWATGHQGIFTAIKDVVANPAAGNNPWFVATLFDTYFAFLWFWLWIAYKETSWLSRGLWLIAVLVTGNMAMAVYALIQLYKLPADATIEDFLLRRPR